MRANDINLNACFAEWLEDTTLRERRGWVNDGRLWEEAGYWAECFADNAEEALAVLRAIEQDPDGLIELMDFNGGSDWEGALCAYADLSLTYWLVSRFEDEAGTDDDGGINVPDLDPVEKEQYRTTLLGAESVGSTRSLRDSMGVGHYLDVPGVGTLFRVDHAPTATAEYTYHG